MSATHNHEFPSTRWSVILQAQGTDSELRDRALEQICRTYWLPVYAFARGQGLSHADAQDLTQKVLVDLLKRRAFDSVAKEKGKLRSFIRVATKNYLRNEWKKAKRLKRGGEATILSLDCSEAEERCSLDAINGETPDRLFDRHWGINLLHLTMERLEATYFGEGKGALFTVIKHVLTGKGEGPKYRDLADVLGMTEVAVKTAVHRLRKRYRRILKEEIKLTLDDESDEAVEEELQYLFGVFAN